MTTTTSFSNTGQWIKRGIAVALLGSAAALLGACGGGGASNTGAAGGGGTSPLAVLPTVTDAFGDTPITFTVSGGKPPYSAASSNSSLFPINKSIGTDGKLTVSPITPATDTDITITFRDSSATAGSTTATAKLKASTLSSTLTITPSTAGVSCGAGAICTGGDGLVSVQAIVGGVPRQGSKVRFDAFQGDYEFVVPNVDPTKPPTLTTTATVDTDSQGFARVVIRAKNSAPTQSAVLQIVSVATGEVRRFVFPIAQVISSTAITITPPKVDWASPFKDACVTGGVSNHFIFGGTPPYTILNTSPDFASISPTLVAAEGGSVAVSTSGLVCSTTGITFIVRDASARTATFTVSNVFGPATGPSKGSSGSTNIPAPTITPSALGPLECGASASAFVVQDNPTTGTINVLPPTSLEPSRVSVFFDTVGRILTVTRLPNGVGGPSPVLVRVSNGATFTDVPVSLAGASPFGCGTNAGSNPVTVGPSGIALTLNVDLGQTISGGIGPFVASSSSPNLVVSAVNGRAFILRGTVAGVYFLTITDQGSPSSSTVIVVTVT